MNRYVDTETCGLHGMPVLLQHATDEGPISLHEIWLSPARAIPLADGRPALVDARFFPMLMTIGRWCLQSRRYAATRFRGKLWLMHRLVMLWEYGEPPVGCEVDHVNRDGLDNRLCNLRYVTQSQNGANKAKRSDNTSGYKGVFWHKTAKKWMAQIGYEGRTHYLGLYDSKKDAANAYDKAARELEGEYACLNNVL